MSEPLSDAERDARMEVLERRRGVGLLMMLSGSLGFVAPAVIPPSRETLMMVAIGVGAALFAIGILTMNFAQVGIKRLTTWTPEQHTQARHQQIQAIFAKQQAAIASMSSEQWSALQARHQPPQPAETQLSDRLRQLEHAHAQGLLSEEEFQRQRAALLLPDDFRTVAVKCSSCGAALPPAAGQTAVTCAYCRTVNQLVRS